jgi:hypothetical protein
MRFIPGLRKPRRRIAGMVLAGVKRLLGPDAIDSESR